MTEQYVQVRVSLIAEAAEWVEELDHQMACEVAARLRALLSQPTPTAEHAYDDPPSCSPCRAGRHDVCSGLPFPRRQCQCKDEGHVEPPRIEYMAAGTTFTAEGRDGTERFCAVANIDHTVADLDDCVFRLDDWFDPSTIRDVTPPKDAA